jgi:D-aspartate ligase
MPGRRHGADQPPVLLLGGIANALSAARSMGRKGRRVFALAENQEFNALPFSRYVSEWVPLGSDEPVEVRWWRWLANGPVGAVVLPCGDIGLEFVARHRRALVESGYFPVRAADEVVLAMLDKRRTFELAHEVGIEAPRVSTVQGPEDIDRVLAEFSFPCAFKPRWSHENQTPRKGYVVRDRQEFHETFQWLRSVGTDMVVTEIVPGVDDSYCSYYSFLDADGNPATNFTKQKIRQRPPVFGDIGTFHATRWYPDAAELGLRFFRNIGLRGLGNVEFKRDARDGRLKLIECNPRLTAANELVHRAGIDFAEIAYRDALGHSLAVPQDFRTGMHFWLPLSDLRALPDYRRRGEFSTARWLTSIARPAVLPLFDHGDPLPSIANAGNFTRRAGSYQRRRGRGAPAAAA